MTEDQIQLHIASLREQPIPEVEVRHLISVMQNFYITIPPEAPTDARERDQLLRLLLDFKPHTTAEVNDAADGKGRDKINMLKAVIPGVEVTAKRRTIDGKKTTIYQMERGTNFNVLFPDRIADPRESAEDTTQSRVTGTQTPPGQEQDPVTQEVTTQTDPLPQTEGDPPAGESELNENQLIAEQFQLIGDQHAALSKAFAMLAQTYRERQLISERFQPVPPVHLQEQIQPQGQVQPQVQPQQQQVQPQQPVQPQGQVQPQQPVQPQGQVQPQQPVQPQDQVQPQQPVQPQGQVQPQQPVQPQQQQVQPQVQPQQQEMAFQQAQPPVAQGWDAQAAQEPVQPQQGAQQGWGTQPQGQQTGGQPAALSSAEMEHQGFVNSILDIVRQSGGAAQQHVTNLLTKFGAPPGTGMSGVTPQNYAPFIAELRQLAGIVTQ